jgi:hypothetical protein
LDRIRSSVDRRAFLAFVCNNRQQLLEPPRVLARLQSQV